MTIKTESKIINITMKLWRGGWDAGYEPDCFDDLENGNFAREFGKGTVTDGTAILASDEDAERLISWWQGEVDTANRGEDGEVLAALTDEERGNGDEWDLIVNGEQ
jgi:hypothetical protein